MVKVIEPWADVFVKQNHVSYYMRVCKMQVWMGKFVQCQDSPAAPGFWDSSVLGAAPWVFHHQVPTFLCLLKALA